MNAHQTLGEEVREQEKIIPSCGCGIKSERGVVLLVVIVLSAVALMIMTALLYMITTGTQTSGLQKRYKTAMEAGEGGGDVFYQLIATRGDASRVASLVSSLSTISFTPSVLTGCSGTTRNGTSVSGLAAKLTTPSTSWVGCNRSLAINTADASTYDMRILLGTTTQYSVYAKIVAATEGNTGGGDDLSNCGSVNCGGGDVEVAPAPTLYAIELVSQNSITTRLDERAKLSVLYQY